MLRFAARRFGQAVVVVIMSTFMAYVGLFVIGDPFEHNNEKTVPPDTQAMLRANFGLDKPFYLRYLTYMKNLFTFDLGVDFDQRRQVSELMTAVLPNTIRLALLAVAIGTLIGVAAGVVAAVWQKSFWDVLTTMGAVLLISVPLFVVAVFLRANLSGLRVFGVEIFPMLPHRVDVDVPWYREILLPALALAGGHAAFIARLMRTSMLETLHADYLNTARAKGLSERRVIIKHGIRNAIIPIVTFGGIGLGMLMGGTIIAEAIFQYNGIGYLFIRALLSNNNPVIMAIAVFAVITFVVLSAVVDVLCAYLDPRIRLE